MNRDMNRWRNIMQSLLVYGLCSITHGGNDSAACKECEKYVSRLVETSNFVGTSFLEENSSWVCSQFRVVGGTEALSKEFPHMALIAYDRWATKFFCGGTIVSEYYIMSAAHCQSNPKWGAPKWVLIGDTDLPSALDDSMPTLIRVAEIIPHPEYTSSAFYNDILLLKLERKILFSPFIWPICLNTGADVAEKYVSAAGWGRVSQGSKRNKKLLKVRLELVNESMCQEQYNNSKFEAELPAGVNFQTMICAGSAGGDKDTCEGDSGGPLQVLSKLHPCIYSQVGITSFGKTCGETNSPGVYTRVSHFIPWIEEIVWP